MKVENLGIWMGLYKLCLFAHLFLFGLLMYSFLILNINFVIIGVFSFPLLYVSVFIIEKIKDIYSNNKSVEIELKENELFLKKGNEILEKITIDEISYCQIFVENELNIVKSQSDIETVMRDKIGMFKWILFNMLFYCRIFYEVSPVSQGLVIKKKNGEKIVWKSFFKTFQLFNLVEKIKK